MAEARVLRPMSNAEILNEAFDLYKHNFALFAGISAVFYLPFALFSGLTANIDWLQRLMAHLLCVPALLVEGAIVKALSDRLLGREATIAGSWRHILQRSLPYLATSFKMYALVGLGFLCFIYPGVALTFRFVFVQYVMVAEDRFHGAAARRSRELAAGQSGRIFMIFLLSLVFYGVLQAMAWLLTYGFGEAFMALFGAFDEARVPLPVVLAEAFLNAVVQTVAVPAAWLLSGLLYFDLRIRKEGFDIELLAQEMGEETISRDPLVAPA